MKIISAVIALLILSASATAAPPDDTGNGTGWCDGLAPSTGLYSTCIQAHSAANRIEHLKAVGANDKAVAKAQASYDEAVATYAELTEGGVIPGFEPPEVVLAIAYINRDGLAGYNAASGDTLISKLLDTDLDGTTSIGDTIVTGQFPTDFNASGVGSFLLNTFQVTADHAEVRSDEVHVWVGNRLYSWVSAIDNCRDHYIETYYGQAYAGWTTIVDGSCGWPDKLKIRAGSPSSPDLVAGDIFLIKDGFTDDAFLEVDIFFDVSFP